MKHWSAHAHPDPLLGEFHLPNIEYQKYGFHLAKKYKLIENTQHLSHR